AVANKKSDLRTTIYWNPDVKITEGRAAFKFYTADVNSRYRIIIEGVTNTGKPFFAKQIVAAGGN
ncbi:MAG: hypothetical protein LBD53_03745, partial [Tannerella sp.]|nr:hypothetical protein [Tannerella sp.]